MKKYCPNCKFVNFLDAAECKRCKIDLIEVTSEIRTPKTSLKSKIIKRGLILAVVCFSTLLGFYLSLIGTSKSLSYDEKKIVQRAIDVIEEKGFSNEVFLLRYPAAFRGNDNWLNASTRFESAYAATNFPLAIVTIYPDFFTYTIDDTERAAILLHEAQHIKGADEKQAYEFVWRNRKKLGWTKETHGNSIIWRNVRGFTKDVAPELFVCDTNELSDCTE